MSSFFANVINSIPIIGGRNGFRPPGWSQPQLTSITANVPVTQQPEGTQPGATIASQPTTYVFDAVFRVEHSQEVRSTEHPVQSGASLVDHSFKLPSRVILDIGMSDTMDAYEQGMFTGADSKSVSAYQTLIGIQELRIPVTLSTRLDLYENMIIEAIRATDDVKTRYGLRAYVYLRQILVAKVSTSVQSARPAQTGNNPVGQSQPVPVPADLVPYLQPIH